MAEPTLVSSKCDRTAQEIDTRPVYKDADFGGTRIFGLKVWQKLAISEEPDVSDV